MPFVAGVVVGFALCTAHDANHLDSTANAQAAIAANDLDPRKDEVLEQLKQINSHATRIDTLLSTGKLRVINIINNP